MRKFDTIYRECKKYEGFSNTTNAIQLVNIFFTEIEADLNVPPKVYEFLLLSCRHNANQKWLECGSDRKFLQRIYNILNNQTGERINVWIDECQNISRTEYSK